MSRTQTLVVFLLLVLGGGLVIGALTQPGSWYASLTKPWFSPPNWIFGPVWTALYIMIAIAGWRIYQAAPKSGAMAAWAAQLGLNFLWSPVFFGAQRPGLALVVLVMLLAAIIAFIALSLPRDRLSAALFVPYAAWVSFAFILNAAIWRLNG